MDLCHPPERTQYRLYLTYKWIIHLVVTWSASFRVGGGLVLGSSQSLFPLALTVTRDVLLVGRAKPDCLEGGTHEETLRPQVNPKVKGQGFRETEVLSRLLKDPRIR